jgi:ribose transport system ATP-binding protein
LIELKSISKSFPGVKSLDEVDFSARAGEIHALLGENGAGKSTLIKVMAGAYVPSSGTILFDGKERQWNSPREAKDAGIHVIYQELILFPELTVAENIFIGNQPLNRYGSVDYTEMAKRSKALLAKLGHDLNPQVRVKNLSVADQQMIEICKAMTGDVKLLVLDEPTAVISGREADMLFERMRLLRGAGVCVIYISHRLEEVFRICDRATVLKDGQLVGTRSVSDLTKDSLITMMVGRKLADIFPKKTKSSLKGEPVLSVRGLRMAPRVMDASFELYGGEILGIAGMVGSGRSELAHAIFGSSKRDAGSVTLAGMPHDDATPRRSIDAGLGLLTEDRKGEGLLLLLDTAANITAPALKAFVNSGLLNRELEVNAAREEIARFRIAVPGPTYGVRELSGGNQQKILFGRWTRTCRKVLILDEPTRGVDVGAKVEIYQMIRELADAGLGVIVISSELTEIIGLCNRVLVMREGRINGEVRDDAVTEESIMELATHDSAALREVV